MQTLSLNLLSKGPEGESLPTVFKKLALYGAHIRQGQLTLIVAASGVGKSSLITFAAMAMRNPDDEPIRTIYFSADSDITTFAIRAGAMAAAMEKNQPSISTEEAEQKIAKRDPEFLSKIHSSTGHIWVNFDNSPSCKDIADEVDAYALVNGNYPELIVVDNLMDVRTGMEERQGQDAVLDYLKQLAGKTQAAVVVLCHAVGEYANGKIPIPLGGIMNKLDKRPRLILTLFEADVTLLGVCVVKNNNGKRDADGNLQVHIPWIKERMWLGT